MKIAIFSAATRKSRSGNWVTASRWASLLRSAGHHVGILHSADQIEGSAADVLIGLHARRSGPAVLKFRKMFPQRLAMVALTGTDLYGDLSPTRKRHSKTATKSLDVCSQIILLQPLMARRLKQSWKLKSSVVMMDVAAKKRASVRKSQQPLRVCVVGHLRHEKDPFRAAMAVRKLPDGVQVHVVHAGQALSDSFRIRAESEGVRNENWNWIGSITHSEVTTLMQRCDLLVNTSRSEGAPNVLFEAMSKRLPVIASKIDGHVGVLGKAYRGYFEVGNTAALHNMLVRCATNESFYALLSTSIDSLVKKYKPGNERKALLKAIANCSV